MSDERWRVEVDRAVCIGSGMCVDSAPRGFTLDSARKSRSVASETDPDNELMEAAESCPVEAISIRTVDGRAVFPPDE
ncbi:ferredoxin [Streptomyces sp. URMC 123]|uniref:ferredoxin n=1 Tax=Streptomyces sp. URMC 123 TaxID=3423403 RepID=UPI003F19E48F